MKQMATSKHPVYCTADVQGCQNLQSDTSECAAGGTVAQRCVKVHGRPSLALSVQQQRH